MPVPPSTYRLQIRPSFGLRAAAQLCEYLRELGAGAVYLSPILASASGSEHGYDVVDFSRVDDARGGAAGWRALVDAAHGLQLVLDVVPNHTGIADAAENEPWWDVLRLGSGSPYARWFDIDWTRGRVLLPVLGDDFDAARDLSVAADELRHGSHRFPIAPGTTGGSAAQVHDRQHYELVSFRSAEQSYRRFFAVPTLAGLRVEDPAVFDATHREVLRLVRDGVAGLRIDHPDGLADPLGYLSRLRAAVPDAWLTVEKILEPGESLPRSWPVAGTTGYDALAEVNALFVDPSAEAALSDLYRSLTGDQLSFDQHVEAGKRLVATTILRPEVRRLAGLCAGIEQAAEAITELLVAFPVYRSYLPEGASHLTAAVETAVRWRPTLADAIAALHPRLADPADELCVRFQQTSGAVMAKGVEDTAYYRYTRFVALNEVGGDPSRFGSGLDGFHAAQAQRQLVAPQGMTTLSTHDTKRGEDVRARLAVLAEMPAEWAALVGDLMARAPVSNAALGYLLWQTFAGTGFIGRDRMHAYAEKAMREAAGGTGWIDPDRAFEAAVHAAVDAAYDMPEIRDPLAAFVERITPFGRLNSLSQKVVALTMPGIPDVYQGTELWEDSLVDPDNRRPVDFATRQALLSRLTAAPPIDETGAAKLWLVSRALRLRGDRPELFTGYAPIRALGPASDHVVAFDRGGAVTVATRLPVRLARDGGWRETTLALAAPHTDVLTGRSWSGAVRVADLLDVLPVALLMR
ncbi:MAG TPA: malto-oligosyltrehalose synthase [Jatrophihabitantaceae bacterium]|nr:malto-oligosyltrehalose synthase [Jatrophihabitantaceae bacterium]